jgi:branched-subunit amino acid ABC-type transport system permease component
VWSVVEQVLGDASRTVTCMGAVDVLAGLTAVGVRVRAALDDPCDAFTLWQPRGLDSAAGVGGAGAGAAGAAATAGEQQQRQPWAGVEETSKAAAAMVLGGGWWTGGLS